MAKKVREISDFLILLRISPHEIWRQNIMMPELPKKNESPFCFVGIIWYEKFIQFWPAIKMQPPFWV